MYFNRARYYDPQIGRFISRDPIGQRDQVNLYTYVANSPLVYVDRMGLEKVLILYGDDKPGYSGLIESLKDIESGILINEGYKPENIHSINIKNIEDLEHGLKLTNYNKIVIVAHANSVALGFSYSQESGGILTLDNISQLDVNVCTPERLIKIVGCNAGSSSNGIAKSLSEITNNPVLAPNGYVQPKLGIDGKVIIGDNLHNVWESFRVDSGLSFLPTLGEKGEFIIFNP